MLRIGRFRYVDVPASREARGRGTLVLIHGFPLNPSMWEPQLTLAANGWRIVVPELRGFGEGSGDPPATSIDDYAGDTIDLLDGLHIEMAVICGLSMGGYAALAMFRHAPRYFHAMVLADTKSQGDSAGGGRRSEEHAAAGPRQGPGGGSGRAAAEARRATRRGASGPM